MFSISPLTNLANCARRAGSSREFLLGLVYAGGGLPPPLPPLPLPGFLVPRRVVVDNLHPLEGTCSNKDVDWSIDQSGGGFSMLMILPKMLTRLG